jgi:hypothetical protein
MWIVMQRDLNFVFSLDESYRSILVLNYGLLPEPDVDYYENGSKISAISRETYLQFYPLEKLAVALGLMDKSYGLRTGDHTAYSRGSIGIGQADQVHGMKFHFIDEEWELTLHGWAGNLAQEINDRRRGGSIMYEAAMSETDVLGFSILSEANQSIKYNRFSIHNKWGIPNSGGSSLLAEVGIRQDQEIDQEAVTGSYGLIQSLINITRGYNFLTIIERTQDEMKFSSTELQRWTIGFLTFPLQRTEVRVTTVQTKNFSPQAVSEDKWQLQGQIHVSW